MDNFTRGTIIALSIQASLMGFTISKLCYDLGFERGKNVQLTTFTDDADGYCLADKPPHKGECHDSNFVSSKRNKR